jgi:hypothetical protein
MNRRIPNGTYGGVRGQGLAAPSYSILSKLKGYNNNNNNIIKSDMNLLENDK